MSIKDQLLAESRELNTAVELDSVFESVELSEDVKTKFSAVFESAVKARALTLAETHIQAISERADELVEARVEEEVTEINESVNNYFEHLVESWKEENKVALENGMKADLFESLMASMKAIFVEHNVEIPSESVDVVAELEAEIQESNVELNKLVKTNQSLKEELNARKMESAVKAATADLTESQKEKVATLAEGMKFDDKFQGKLEAIVEMVAAKKSPAEEDKSPAATDKRVEVQTDKAVKKVDQPGESGDKLKRVDESLDGLNGEKPEVIAEAKKPANAMMDQYLRATLGK